MSAILQVGHRQIGAEEVISLLTSPQVLPHLLRELVIDEAIAPFAPTQQELATLVAKLRQQPQYAHNPLEQIEMAALRKLKLGKFKEETWGAAVEAEFINHREKFDRVLFSLIQTEDLETIQELYFRLQEGEGSFSQLSQQYSKGPEAKTNGLVGPLELYNIHPKLAKMLRRSKRGQISPPFRVDKWIVIVRLERYFPAQLDEKLWQRLLNEKFEQWIKEKIGQDCNSISISEEALAAVAGEREKEVLPQHEEDRVKEPSLNDFQKALEDFIEDETLSSNDALVEELRQELRKRKILGVGEALALSVIPFMLGGWSIAALFGFGSRTSPFNPTAIASNILKGNEEQQEAIKDVPPQEAFRVGVNYASEAGLLTEKAQTPEEWQEVMENWSKAIELMRIVPPDTDNYPKAQKKVIEYQGNLEYASGEANDPSRLFRAAINKASSAFRSSKSAQSQEEWIEVANLWKKAIEFMQSVNQDSPHYTTAQKKAIEYQAYLNYVEEKAVEQTAEAQ